MNSRCLIVVAALASAAALAPVAAQAKTLKECAAQWDQMKYRDFTKQCMSGAAAPVGAAPAPAAPATAAPAPAAGAAKPATGSPGRQAMIARERACDAEWKADKAAGRIEAGMKWPQFWHECDARKMAQGM